MIEVGSKIRFERNKKTYEGEVIRITKKCYYVDIGEKKWWVKRKDAVEIDVNIVDIKPFLKWVGGKTQIIDKIKNKIPLEINNYHEIFLGGGSVLLLILKLNKHKSIKIKDSINAYDLNKVLINTYNWIKNKPTQLYKLTKKIVDVYNNCDINGPINRNPTNIIEAKTSK